MDVRALPDAVEPDVWFVCFHPTSTIRWLSLITPGPFKHVSAFAYAAGFQAWLIFDVQPQGTRLQLLRSDVAEAGILAWSRGCTIVRMPRRERPGLNIGSRFFLYCGPAVRHLVGFKGWGLTPTSIYKECLRAGGEVVAAPKRALPPVRPAPIPIGDAAEDAANP